MDTLTKPRLLYLLSWHVPESMDVGEGLWPSLEYCVERAAALPLRARMWITDAFGRRLTPDEYLRIVELAAPHLGRTETPAWFAATPADFRLELAVRCDARIGGSTEGWGETLSLLRTLECRFAPYRKDLLMLISAETTLDENTEVVAELTRELRVLDCAINHCCKVYEVEVPPYLRDAPAEPVRR